MEMRVRKAGEADFTDKTRRYGVEVYVDSNKGNVIYITDVGSIAVAPPAKPPAQIKPPQWSHAMEVRVRKAGEADFTDKTQRYGIEVFIDPNSGNVIYITDNGYIAIAASSKPPAQIKSPQWSHAMEVRVRKAGEADFTDKTGLYGIEAYIDANNGNALYIAETGSLTVVAATEPPPPPAQIAGPKWSGAFELKIRRLGEATFSATTKSIGAEIYFDPNMRKSFIVTQTGILCGVDGTAGAANDRRPPQWLQRMELRARKGGEANFTDKTQRYPVEVYTGEVPAAVIYVSESGAVSAAPIK
jgi:hypothetical protein